MLHDQKVPGAEYCSLKELGMKGRYSVSNSHLSEFGVLGFELGFSMATPHSLGMVSYGRIRKLGTCKVLDFGDIGYFYFGR